MSAYAGKQTLVKVCLILKVDVHIEEMIGLSDMEESLRIALNQLEMVAVKLANQLLVA